VPAPLRPLSGGRGNYQQGRGVYISPINGGKKGASPSDQEKKERVQKKPGIRTPNYSVSPVKLCKEKRRQPDASDSNKREAGPSDWNNGARIHFRFFIQ
jgi:hypothetical protein